MRAPLTIDRLNLRLPVSMSAHAEEVTDAMSETLAALPVSQAREIDALSLGPLTVSATTSPRALGQQIAHAIADAVRGES